MDIQTKIIDYLDAQGSSLFVGHIARLKLTPLLLRIDLPTLFKRRTKKYKEWHVEQRPFGCTVNFVRQTKSSAKYPTGQVYNGAFDLLKLDESCVIISSTLSQDNESYGPKFFVDHCYPLALRPFLNSNLLWPFIQKKLEHLNYKGIALDTMGYDEKTHEFRRDMKRESIFDAVREMKTQNRRVHRMKIECPQKDNDAGIIFSMDRYIQGVCYAGSPRFMFSEFIMPNLENAINKNKDIIIQRMPNVKEQKELRLTFGQDTFSSYDDMHVFVDALRGVDGINTTIVHLNPYLQAQVIDFLSGQAIQITIMDDRTVNFVPRTQNCTLVVGKLINVISEKFGEPAVSISSL